MSAFEDDSSLPYVREGAPGWDSYRLRGDCDGEQYDPEPGAAAPECFRCRLRFPGAFVPLTRPFLCAACEDVS